MIDIIWFVVFITRHTIMINYVRAVYLLLQKTGFEYMLQVASSDAFRAKHLVRSAQFNVGRAYYQGFGVKRSEEQAEKYCVPVSVWLIGILHWFWNLQSNFMLKLHALLQLSRAYLR